MKKVVVFRHDILCRSETFIRAQVLSLQRWHPVLTGYRAVTGGLDLKGLESCVIFKNRPSPSQLLYLYLCQLLNLPHAPTHRILGNFGADLIHVHFGIDAVDIWPSVRSLKLPMLITLHGYDINIHQDWWRHGGAGLKRRRYPQRLLQLAQQRGVHFIAVSEAIRKQAIKFGIPAEKITVCHIGVDVSAFQPGSTPLNQRPRRILFVGRLVEKKGAEYLIRAFAQLLPAVHGAELVLIGEGPLKNSLQETARALGVNVLFLGARDTYEVKQELHKARVLCLPSITAANGDAEGMGMVLLEAGACGVPAITSARGGAHNAVIDGITGYCVAEKDVVQLAERLQELLLNDALCSKMGEEARHHVVAQFDINRCTGKLEQIYDRFTESAVFDSSTFLKSK